MGKLVSSLLYPSAISAATEFFSSNSQFLISAISSDWVLLLKCLFPQWSSPYLYSVTTPSVTDFLLASSHTHCFYLEVATAVVGFWVYGEEVAMGRGKFIPSGIG